MYIYSIIPVTRACHGPYINGHTYRTVCEREVTYQFRVDVTYQLEFFLLGTGATRLAPGCCLCLYGSQCTPFLRTLLTVLSYVYLNP